MCETKTNYKKLTVDVNTLIEEHRLASELYYNQDYPIRFLKNLLFKEEIIVNILKSYDLISSCDYLRDGEIEKEVEIRDNPEAIKNMESDDNLKKLYAYTVKHILQ